MANELITSGEKLLISVLEKLKDTANVNVVFGESRVIGDKTIIPVALVSHAFGAGSGGGSAGPEGEAMHGVGGGGGGGGRVKVRPLGVLEVTPRKTIIVPVVDVTRLTTLALVGLLTVFLLRRRKRA
ncbi:MAG: hypothetical protein M1358_24545 [Chloroflexi bacterium]|nr:hypothetical protein [Chloroflexota bacterium]